MFSCASCVTCRQGWSRRKARGHGVPSSASDRAVGGTPVVRRWGRRGQRRSYGGRASWSAVVRRVVAHRGRAKSGRVAQIVKICPLARPIHTYVRSFDQRCATASSSLNAVAPFGPVMFCCFCRVTTVNESALMHATESAQVYFAP